ncbi:MAG TPA: GFA family protein [Burkholderiales bacterium]|nr:GFA family protein [Burkholderiales bacterium]
MDPSPLRGGCYCGAIRYEAGGEPYNESCCHCSICRRTSGAPFVAWFTVPRKQFRYVSGAPARFASTPQATRAFCARCGTQLTFEHRGYPGEIDVTTCSLDRPELLPPKDHIFTASQLRWVHLDDGLPAFPERRT